MDRIRIARARSFVIDLCREVAVRPRQAAGGRADGECFARISVRTLLVKKWKITYFIFELPDLLLLYRSRDDHMYNPKGTMIKKRVEVKHNHTLTRLKRKVRGRQTRAKPIFISFRFSLWGWCGARMGVRGGRAKRDA